MDRWFPLILLVFAAGGFYLALSGLILLRPHRPEVWFFGLGVRSRLGAVKVLMVSASLLLLACALNNKITLERLLAPETESLQSTAENLRQQLAASQQALNETRKQLQMQVEEKNSLDGLIARQGNGLAQKSDVVGELKTMLLKRQREISELSLNLDKARLDLSRVQGEQQQSNQALVAAQEQIRQIESKMDVLTNEKNSLAIKLQEMASQRETDQNKKKNEIDQLLAAQKAQEGLLALIRQGLALRESNDWALEQELQRLNSLVSRQIDLNAPGQTDIARSLQRCSQILNEGATLTKQARTQENRTSSGKK